MTFLILTAGLIVFIVIFSSSLSISRLAKAICQETNLAVKGGWLCLIPAVTQKVLKLV